MYIYVHPLVRIYDENVLSQYKVCIKSMFNGFVELLGLFYSLRRISVSYTLSVMFLFTFSCFWAKKQNLGICTMPKVYDIYTRIFQKTTIQRLRVLV